MADQYITDQFDQPVGVGDIIVYAGCSNSSAQLTRGEVTEILEMRTKRTTQWGSTYWSNYKMKVRPENGGRISTLTRAPFILVVPAIDFTEYVASIKEKYEIV